MKREYTRDELLAQATKYNPLRTYVQDGVQYGLYRLDGNVVRAFPVCEVEKKRREMFSFYNGKVDPNTIEESEQ